MTKINKLLKKKNAFIKRMKMLFNTNSSPAWYYTKEANLERCRDSLLNKEAYLNHHPLEIQIELSNECNLRCIMCPYHFEKNGAKKFIDYKFLKTLKPLYPFFIKA